MNIIKQITSCSLIINLFLSSVAFAQSNIDLRADSYNIKEVILPSEAKKVTPKTGAMFMAPAVKDKVLIPVHFWGEVANTGLNFIPANTNLVNGLSLAGGPKADGILDAVRVTRRIDGKILQREFDLTEGGDEEAYTEVLKPNDTVFIEKSYFRSDRAYYTSLIGVLATILSSILLYREVKKNR